ncbi:F-box/LRR-repeat protein 2-like [Argopecten irradians]|uniref:F-box/LRR-repeat protein 2-like n=1 Tax=Argopecten irradians TaxID=31199 RepID=UPI00371FF8F6
MHTDNDLEEVEDLEKVDLTCQVNAVSDIPITLPTDSTYTSAMSDLSTVTVSATNLENSSNDDEEKEYDEIDYTHLASVVQNDIRDISKRISKTVIDYHLSCQEEEEGNSGQISNFDMVPNEILLKIFSYLEVLELCRRISPVCRRWRKLAYDPSLWYLLDLNWNPRLSSVDLCWIIRRLGCIRKLQLQNRQVLSLPEVAIFTEFCPMLIDVDLGFCSPCSAEILECFIANCEHLERINVEGCDMVADECCKILAKAKNLKHLNFSHCLITDFGVSHLARNLSQIVSLNIDGIGWISDRSITTLVEHQHKHLRWLDIDGIELTDKSLEAIASCEGLERLTVSFCELFTDAALQEIKKMKNLTCLALKKGIELTNAGIIDLFSSDTLANLTSLDLSDCGNLLDSAVLQITKCCGKNLRKLYLCWCCNLREESITAIVDTCSSLEILELAGLHKILGKCFGRIPKCMPRLTLLDLRQCNEINDNLIREMLHQKSDLKAFDYYGEDFRFPFQFSE